MVSFGLLNHNEKISTPKYLAVKRMLRSVCQNTTTQLAQHVLYCRLGCEHSSVENKIVITNPRLARGQPSINFQTAVAMTPATMTLNDCKMSVT